MSRPQDIFPEPVSDIVLLDSSKEHWIYHLTRIMAYVSHIVPYGESTYHMPLERTWMKGKGLDHLKFCLHAILSELPYDSRQFGQTWDAICRRLRRDPSRSLNNANVCLLFRLDNMFLVKRGFTFGNWTASPGMKHVVQTSNAAMLCYELPKENNVPSKERIRRHLPERYQMFYNRYVLPPHGTYVIPERTSYVLVSVQKCVFTTKA